VTKLRETGRAPESQRRRPAIGLIATLLVIGSVAALPAGAAEPARAALIPLETLTAAPMFWDPLLSPDGSKVSYVAMANDAPNLWVAPADRFSAGAPVTAAGGRGVTTSNVAGYRVYRWTADSKNLLYLQDQGGDERWHLMLTNVESGATRDLTPIENVQVRLVGMSRQQPDQVLVEINDRRPDRHDLYRIDLQSGARRLVYRNDRFIGIFADNSLQPRLAVAGSADGGFDVFKFAGGNWRQFYHLRQEDTSALIRAVEQNAWNFSADNRQFRIYDSRGRDSWAIVEIDLKSGRTRALASDPKVDVDSAIYDADGRLAAWRANWTRAQWRSGSPTIRSDLDFLQSHHEGDLEVANRSRLGNRWLVSYVSGGRSPEFYLFDRGERRLVSFAAQVPSVNDLDLPDLQPQVIVSEDGMNLVSYLLLPRGTTVDQNGVLRVSLPMIVYVHGGPNDERAVYGYSGRLQWLAARGYAVLNVNYRGSPGFGKRFLNAQNLEWGNKMNRDVIDQVHWAVGRGIADAHRVGILGGSYGGYEVLAAMTKTPDVFACGAALAAPSEMESFIRIWWENFIPAGNMAYKSIVLGDPDTDAGRAALHESSPLYFARQAKRPFLIAQGGRDTRVPIDQAQRMVDALRANGVPVTYAVYPNEGHGLATPENARSFYAMVEAFYGRCLGGEYAPITNQLEGAHLDIPVGADLVPGLKQAYGRLVHR
jgi:dipeptidyl aminopeptidase/acylaminoacyl peptidase